jgi:hypothetical protein
MKFARLASAVCECIEVVSDDQIAPIADSALLCSTIVKDATPKVHYGVPHGMPSTLDDKINGDLIAFFHPGRQAAT